MGGTLKGNAIRRPPKHDWSCPSCTSDVPGGFGVCWSCGTSRDGQLDPSFRPVEETHSEEIESPPDHEAAGLQFGLRLTFVVIAISAIVMAVGTQSRTSPIIVRLLMSCAVVVILGSVIVALNSLTEKMAEPVRHVFVSAVVLLLIGFGVSVLTYPPI